MMKVGMVEWFSTFSVTLPITIFSIQFRLGVSITIISAGKSLIVIKLSESFFL